MRIRRAEILWLAAVATLLVLAVWWFPGSASLDTDSFSVSFSGKKALYQSLRRLDSAVSRSLETLIPRPGFGDRLLILGPARYPSAEEWEELYWEVYYGATLVFAASNRDPSVNADAFGAKVVPWWSSKDKNASKSEPAEASSETAEEDSTIERDEPDSDEDDSRPGADESDDSGEKKRPSLRYLERRFTAETDLVDGDVDWRTEARLEIDLDDWKVLVSADSKPQVVVREVGEGTVVFAASDEIFTNQALTDPKRALLAYRIIESSSTYAGTWFDETLNSSGVPKVVGILFDPLFRPVTLQLMLLAVLFGWSASLRFGPAEPPSAPRRRSIVEHAEALGILYFRAGAGGRAVSCLHEFLKQELRRLYGTTFPVENAAAVARQARLDEREVNALLAETSGVSGAKVSNSQAGRLLRSLAGVLSRIRNEPG